MLKTAISEFAEAGLAESANRLFSGVGKTLAKVFDITGKISSVGQALERTAGVVTPLALALERSIIVIGDPFNPDVDRISPNIGQEGETVTVSGRNFGFPLPDGQFTVDENEDITVQFCQVAMSAVDPENAAFDMVLDAEIQRRTNTQILITVPDNFEETFDTGAGRQGGFMSVSIRMEHSRRVPAVSARSERSRSSSPQASWRSGPTRFYGGSMFTVRGERFGESAVAIFDDDPATPDVDEGTIRKPVRVEDDFLIVQLPPPTTPGFGDGAHTVTVKRGSKKSGAAPFTIGFPTRTPGTSSAPPFGWTITITSLTDTIGNDGEVSVIEAFKYANGELVADASLACTLRISPP